MDIEQLRTLVAIAEAGSLAEAARQLGHPKSTVAKRVAQLERHLAVRLLDRGPRSVRLTDEAIRLIEPARDLLARADEIRTIASDQSTRLVGRLRVSVPTLLGTTLLPGMLARFASRHPLIDLRIAVEDRYVDVVADGYDCAVRLGPGNDPGIVRRRLGASVLILVADVDFAEAAAAGHPGDLENLDALAFEAGSAPALWNLARDGESFRLKPQVRLTCQNLSAIARMLKSLRAVALLPRFLVDEEIRAGRLVRVCPEWQGEHHEISVVFPSRVHMPARMRALVDHLVDEFRSFGG